MPLCRTVEQILMRTRLASFMLMLLSDADEGETMCMSNRLTSMSVSKDPQTFGATGLTY